MMTGLTHGEEVAAGLRRDDDFTGVMSVHHNCIDCGYNTAPGCPTQAESEASYRRAKAEGRLEQWGEELSFDQRSEVYIVRDAIWKKAEMEPYGGCLCIGCLEKRLGRALRPKDFDRNHPFFQLPGTPRLLKRQKRAP